MITTETEATQEEEIVGFVKYDIPGCKPLIIAHEDMVSDLAYYRLAKMRAIDLQDYDFKEYDTYLKYAFNTLGLLHYPLVIVSGEVGGGKSLFLAWLAYQIARLFPEKRATTDFSVPPLYDDPPIYDDHGNRIRYTETNGVSRWLGVKRYSLYDQDFIENVRDGMNDLSKFMKDNNGRMPPRSELEKIKIFNANLALDEAKKWARKGLKTNLRGFVSDIITMRRHMHCGIEMAYVDSRSVPGLEVMDQKTHFVTANVIELGNYKECRYYIQEVHGKKSGMPLTLIPANNLDIWNSFDVPEFQPMVKVLTGNAAVKEQEKRREEKLKNGNSELRSTRIR